MGLLRYDAALSDDRSKSSLKSIKHKGITRIGCVEGIPYRAGDDLRGNAFTPRVGDLPFEVLGVEGNSVQVLTNKLSGENAHI
jgi:hypothetical protein